MTTVSNPAAQITALAFSTVMWGELSDEPVFAFKSIGGDCFFTVDCNGDYIFDDDISESELSKLGLSILCTAEENQWHKNWLFSQMMCMYNVTHLDERIGERFFNNGIFELLKNVDIDISEASAGMINVSKI